MSRRVGVILTILAVSLCSPRTERSLPLTEASGSEAPVPVETKAHLVKDYGAQPLHFEHHEEQAGTNATYIARGQGYALLLNSDELTLTLKRGRRAPGVGTPGSPFADEAPAPGTTVRVRLSGANPKAHLTGLDPLPGRSNYFIGNDPSQWRTNVPHYARVRLASVYPGIDLVFYGKGRQLEHDFIVAPGADPRQIQLAFTGADRVSLTPTGDLTLALPGGDLILRAPVAYQDAASGRVPVSARFVVADNRNVGFEIAAYDPSKPLVIDPVLTYSTYLGGGAGVDKTDRGNGIAVDTAGNAYVVGMAYPTDFPTTAGAFDRSGGYAGFVAKFNPGGNLVYSTFLGGGGYLTAAHAVAVDSSGHAYVTGYTGRTDFPTTPGAFQTSCAPGGSPYGCNDAFVVKLNPEGSGLVYSTYLGGPSDPTTPGVYGDDSGNGVAIDNDGNAYVVGLTRSNRFPVTAGAFQTTYAGGWADVFIAKLNATGTALVYATYLGGTGGYLHGDEPYAIAVDGHGQAYVTGQTTSADFPTTSGAFKPTWSGYTEGFISKLSADGSALAYSTYLGGPGAGGTTGRGIAVDAAGNAYVTGAAGNGFTTTPGAFQPHCAPAGLCADAFVLKLNPAGSAPVWSTYLGGTASEQGNAIALDSQGHVYVTGSTLSTDFPTRFPVQGTYAGGDNGWHGDYYGGDVVVTKLSADGSRALYSTYLGGGGADAGLGIAVDRAGNAYGTGLTESTDFPTVNAAQASNHGSWDVIVFKLGAVTYNLTLAKTGTGTGTVTSNPSGISCGSTCSAAFDQGERVTLTATAATGSTFTGWSGACTGTGACVLDMDQARSVTATFKTAPPTITVLAASPASPQPVGTVPTLTASVTGTASQCKWLVTTDPSWATYTVLRTWQACSTAVSWSPTSPGTYQLGLWARSSGNTVDAPEGGAAAAFAYTITAPMPPTITGLSASPTSPRSVGTPISLTATVTGGTSPQQCKWLVTTDPTWATYATLRTWTACTTPAPWTPSVAGTYQVGLWARSSGNTTDAPEGNAAAVLAYTITGPVPPRITGLSANLPSPQAVGTALSLSATVTGGTSPQQCKWLLTTDPTWATYTVLRTWTACSSPAPWTPSVAGAYQLGLWARSSGNTVDAPEGGAAAVLAYTITGPLPPTITGLGANLPSPQVVGTALSLTATVTGGTSPQQCKWLLTTDPTWATYSVLRTWTACTTPAPWTPTVAGAYQLGLWARSAGNTTDAPEGGSAAVLSYTITGPLPPTITALSANLASPQVVGTALSLSATVTGGTSPQQCKWLLTTDPAWTTYSVLRTWTACTSPAPWTPTVAGTYQLGLWARSNGNTTDAPEGGAAAVLAYTITPPTVTVTATPPAPQRVGTPLAFSATVSGGTAPHQCKWLVATDPSWATYTVLRDWQACTTPATWTPTAPWSYQVGVWARSAGNTVDAPEASAALSYTVTPMTVTVVASPAAPQVAGTALTLTATVTGGTAPQQCKWFATTDPTWATYTILRTWQACTSPVSWTPTSAGSYVVAVWARSSGSTADAPEAGAGLAYEILFNLAGSWNYAESGSVTYTITYAGVTETDTQPVSQSGTVGVTQNLTEICLTPPGVGTSFRRCGSLRGNVVELSGIGCAPLPGLDMTFSVNSATARGTVSADGRTMWLTGSTSCQGAGTYEGVPFTFRASGSSTVTMTR